MPSFLDVYRDRTPGSEKLFQRARKVMPGGIAHSIHYFPPYPVFVKGAQGARFWDVDGNEYVDLWMGHYTHILGHHPEVIAEAIASQVKEGIHWGIVFEKQIEWAELVHQLIPCAELVRFCCSGTESTMYAVRVARAFTRKNTILKIGGGWHGPNADLTLAIKWPFDQSESQGLLPELANYTKAIPLNDQSGTLDIIRQNKDDLAGIIVETAVGEGGFVPPTGSYLEMLRSETQRLGALLIFDEVITGCRLALGGAQQRFKMLPDLTTLGKIIGGGLPVGAVVGRREILELTSPERAVKKSDRILIGGGTFSAHPLTVAAGMAMLGYLKDHAEEVYPSLEAKGDKIRRGLAGAFKEEGVDAVVTGIGSLFQTHFPVKTGMVFDSPQAINQFSDVQKREIQFRIRMLNHGVHVMHGGGALSITHTDEDIRKIIDGARAVAREMAQT